MTDKHTPGPWEVCELGPDEWQINSEKREYCLFQITSPIIGDGPLTDEDKANARLAAAAPALLQAIENLLEYPGAAWAIDQARAALTKATGE